MNLIEEYKAIYHEEPDMDLINGKKASKDGNNYIQLIGNCSDIGYLGKNRIKGPVDNVLTKGTATINYLIHNTYLNHLIEDKPILFNRKPSYRGDQNIGYDYTFAQIIHNNPLEDKYIQEIKKRINIFNTFNFMTKKANNYYFVCCLNMYDINNQTNLLIDNHFENIIKYLDALHILDKCIFVQTKTNKIKGTANWWAKNIQPIINKYKLKMIIIEDNQIWGDGVDKSHEQFLDKVKDII